MNKISLFFISCVFTGTLSSLAQGRNDAFVLNAGISVPAGGIEMVRDGSPFRQGGFRKYEFGAVYEKFIWNNFFVAPELSLWYGDNYDDKLIKFHYDPGYDPNPEMKPGKRDSWQFGATIGTMAAWRVQPCRNFSFDVITGPRLDINFVGKVKGYGLEYSNFYRTATFDWRIGLGLNIATHLRFGVNFDFRSGRYKNVDTGEEYIFWRPSGEQRRNAWNLSIGYRF